MIGEFFINLLFGHLFGDYIFQNKWMALNKSKSSWICFVHCFIYTFFVASFTASNFYNMFNIWLSVVFISHYILDRYNLADHWLQMIQGRSVIEFLNDSKYDKECKSDDKDNYQILRGGFTALVYAVVDNTMHLAIMYYIGYFLVYGSFFLHHKSSIL